MEHKPNLKSALISMSLLLLSHLTLMGQVELPTVASAVYAWEAMPAEWQENRIRRPFFKGSTTHLAHFEIHASTLEAGEMPHASHVHQHEEELVIIKDGLMQVTIETDTFLLGPGSIALILPEDEHGFSNAGDTPASYYIIKYRSRAPMDLERGRKAGGSFVVDWKDLPFSAHSKGGRRNYFDRATSMCENFEMHVTDLKPGLKSHDPHTHIAEEILLPLAGQVEEQIREQKHGATVGDVIFLDSMVPHAIENIGEEMARYFAFQWR